MEPQITLGGNLVADPDRTVVAGGSVVTKLRVACNGRRQDKETGAWTDTDPVFLTVICWNRLADNAFQTLHKGDTVVVHGKLLMREYVDGAGQKRQVYEVRAQSVGPELTRYVAQLGRPVRELPGADSAPTDGDPSTEGPNPWGEPEPPREGIAEPAA